MGAYIAAYSIPLLTKSNGIFMDLKNKTLDTQTTNA